MSSTSVYTIVDRTDEGSKPNNKRESVTRFQVPPSFGTNATSVRRQAPVVHSGDESKFDDDYSFTSNDSETSKNCENILFVFLNLDSKLTSNFMDSLRAINNDVQTYTDPSTCLDVLRSLHERIFFISTSADRRLIEEFHHLDSVEAMFILNSKPNMIIRFPKLYGVYRHSEELLMALKDTLEWFQETQMNLFVFEHDRIFLWSQLWKEEFLKSQKSEYSSNKEKLIQVAQTYYRQNLKLNQSINEFDQSYNTGNALQWCFSSPFPASFLHHALRTPNTEHLDACRFLLTDASHIIQQQPDKKTSCELYRGMKMTNEFLDKLENHLDELMCAKGFLTCSQSRRVALEAANSPEHRPDLVPVLFKITYDRSVPLAELSNKSTASSMVFDIYTAFRVKYVNRGQVSIVKIELADEDGRQLARDYRMKHRSESVETLLDQLLFPSKYPAKLPSHEPALLTECVLPELSPKEVSLSIIAEDNGEEEKEGEEDEEVQAQSLIQRGEIDKAIAIYQRLEADPRILNIIGLLYSEKKGEYDTAIKYYKQALKLQEKKGGDVTDTLSQVGNVHQNRGDYDLALACHSRALHKRKKMSHIDPTLIAKSLTGMANAYWGQRNFMEALKHAEEALALNESIEAGNEMHIAANLATLSNIHQSSGDTDKALEVATRAFTLLERSIPPDSPALATLINNIGTMQVAKGLFADARHSFDKALQICEKSLPEGHPKRVSMANNIQRITEMEKRMNKNQNDNLD